MLVLNNFDTNDFLRNYWQQKPLLLRNALPCFNNPLSPEELAGLACEQDIEARIIIEKHGQWKLKSGPFNDEDFLSLPSDHWTLLVQALDHWVPEIADLLNYFRFIPNWRIDDIMASFAPQGGSTGPHTDAYDVFLIQGLGQRHWQVGKQYLKNDSLDNLQNNDQLRLLADFEPHQQWTLDAGDILYLPANYSHWGMSVSDKCMTYSVGFRAPSYAEILSNFCDHQIDTLDEQLRLTDSNLVQQDNPGEISAATLKTIKHIILQQLDDTEQIETWFGRFITQAKYPLPDDDILEETDFDAVKDQLVKQGQLLRNPSVRFAFTHNTSGGILFVDGKHFQCSKTIMPLVQLLSSIDHFCSTDILKLTSCSESRQLFLTLFSHGYLYCDNELLD